jgi:RimJ/RimL family protein N-acetyltransferase
VSNSLILDYIARMIFISRPLHQRPAIPSHPFFHRQPELEGSMIRMRPLTYDDFESLYEVARDAEVWAQHPEKTRYQKDVFRKFFDKALESHGALLALDAVTGQTLGSSRYTNLDLSKSQVEVGYTFLARSTWGLGFNREMKKLMLAYAFQYVNRVVFYIGEENVRSRKAVEKIGASLLERIPSQPPLNVPYVVYKVDKGDFRLHTAAIAKPF